MTKNSNTLALRHKKLDKPNAKRSLSCPSGPVRADNDKACVPQRLSWLKAKPVVQQVERTVAERSEVTKHSY